MAGTHYWHSHRILIALAILFSQPGAAAQAPDFEREARLAAEIEDAILDGEPLYLTADKRKFLAIFTEAETAAPRGAVIVLHGRGFHPDWHDVVQPLRVGLTERGWHTLSLQMPVLGKDAKYYDYVPILQYGFPRIEAGIDFLQAQGVERIVIAAHSCSVHMSMAWLKARGDDRIHAYIGLGMGATDYKQPMQAPFPLAGLNIPVLDAYGDRDYPAVKRKAPERKAAMAAAGNPKSRQIVVPGADHYFKDSDEALLEAVGAWLDSL